MAPGTDDRRAPVPRHVPVLLRETLTFLAPERGGIFVDCTVGLGGHGAAILERGPQAQLVALDRDAQALEAARRRLGPFAPRVRFVRGRFSEVSELLGELGIDRVDGLLADLGVSSLQLDSAERGFSFRFDGPLDMRMGASERTAKDIVNGYPEETLTKIIREFGEERQARRIARAIDRRRSDVPFETTADLCRVVESAVRQPRGKGRFRRPRIHPATRTFQALRIEANRELEELDALLEQTASMLEDDGRLVIISYHSLEDRRVKGSLRELATGTIEPITGRPRSETQVIEVLTKKPVRPGEAEIETNPRARSARLRAARRLPRQEG